MRLSKWLTHLVDKFYIWPFNKLMSLQIFRYAVCGGMTYLVFNWVLYYMVFHYLVGEQDVDLGVVVLSGHVATLAVVFPVSVFIGFWLQRNVAFKSSPLRHRTQAFRYLLTTAGALLINYLLLKLLVEVFHIYPTPSQMICTLLITAYSYVMQKYFTFRGSINI